ncbi:unnamed protein product [Prunus armeniaca]|uniref:Uncharacterized protein n=1 Tax=Prunus armeniaca TaxID=36596 RepID=A0A6J5UEX2_PRUAR|nr:unnamed protein product [Prunus armeniaca]CAB4305389.1 unnamed protein product [Prunus armeniaca]
MASWVLLPVAPVTGRCLLAPVRTQRSSSIFVRSSLDTNVSDMSVNVSFDFWIFLLTFGEL